MSDERWFEWCIFYEFLERLDLDDDERDECAWTVRVLALQNSFDLCLCLLHAFGCLSPMHQSHHATSLNEMARFIKWALNSNCSPVRAWTKALSHLAFCIFFNYALHVHVHFIHHFYFFIHIKKFITLKLMVQFTLNFLCNVPCDVYFFMDIFPEFVLG